MDFWVERIIGMYTIKNTFYGGVLNDKKYGLGRKVCWIVCNFLEGHQYWKRTILCIHFYPYRYAGNQTPWQLIFKLSRQALFHGCVDSSYHVDWKIFIIIKCFFWLPCPALNNSFKMISITNYIQKIDFE